jgi:hypothetical protein
MRSSVAFVVGAGCVVVAVIVQIGKMSTTSFSESIISIPFASSLRLQERQLFSCSDEGSGKIACELRIVEATRNDGTGLETEVVVRNEGVEPVLVRPPVPGIAFIAAVDWPPDLGKEWHFLGGMGSYAGASPVILSPGESITHRAALYIPPGEFGVRCEYHCWDNGSGPILSAVVHIQVQ